MEHCEGLVRLIQLQLPNLPGLSFGDVQKIKAMAKISDYPEAIVGDFRPGEVDVETKHRVEYLAACVLFEKCPRELQLFEEYQQQNTNVSKLASDFDKIHPVLIASHYETRKPGITEEFYQSASRRLKTDQGKELLDRLHRDVGYRDMLVENIHGSCFSGKVQRM